MERLFLFGAVIAVQLAVIGGYAIKSHYDDIATGVQKQRNADLALANQNLADRRIRDATFDKMDAAAVCRKFGLEWVFVDGKSECH